MSDYLNIAREVISNLRKEQRRSAAPMQSYLKGQAVELWSDTLGERFWLVADEEDAELLGEPRGTIYTAQEARQIVEIADPNIVAEVHLWKREFNATLRECSRQSRGE